MTRFRGGPLEDARECLIHSLVVHMRGDGRHSIGWYEQVYDEDVPGVFEWKTKPEYDEHGEPA